MTHHYWCWVLQKCTKYFRFWIVKISDQILAFPVCPQTSVLWEMLFDNNRESQEVRTCWVRRFQRISNQFFSSRSQFKFPKDYVLISLLKWNISDLKLDCLFLNFYHFFSSLLTSSSLWWSHWWSSFVSWCPLWINLLETHEFNLDKQSHP